MAGFPVRFDAMGAITAPDGSRPDGSRPDGSRPGGSPAGAFAGLTLEHASAGAPGDAATFEYIVHGSGGALVSVVQKDQVPLALGQRVLVTGGNQAHVVPDGAVPLDPARTRLADAAGAD